MLRIFPTFEISIAVFQVPFVVFITIKYFRSCGTSPLPTVTSADCPQYPSDAESMCLQGTVKLQVTTGEHQVVNVKLVSGHPVLARAAIKNVQTWKFAETSPMTFTVTYVYANEGIHKRDPVTKCDARMELPTHVTVSTKFSRCY